MGDVKNMLTGKTIVIGATACSPIAKLPELLFALRDLHANVKVVMTPNAAKIMPPLLIGHASGNSVDVEGLEEPKSWDKNHKPLAKADLFAIIPASANTIGKAAHGIADNLLTTTILSAECPVMFVPNMGPKMFANPRVQRNIQILKDDGCIFMECDSERPGKMPSKEKIISAITELLK